MMSRKIKFRAYGINPNSRTFEMIENGEDPEKEMFQVDSYFWEEWGGYGEDLNGDCLPDEIDKLMQYTGKNSINGLEIYEDDIVFAATNTKQNEVGIVQWSEKSADYEIVDTNGGFVHAFGIEGDKYYKMGNKHADKALLNALSNG